MAYRGERVLAIVPARGGSKGIPGKNLKQVGGMSLIARTASVARSLPWIDALVLSSDDEKMIAEGRRVGLDVPSPRPAHLSGDTALSVDVWRHAWLEADEYFGAPFDISVFLEPTSPLRIANDIERCVAQLTDSPYLAAATVSETPAHYTPHKTLKIDEDGTIGFYLDTGSRHSLRQTIPTYYNRNGACYAARRGAVIERGTIVEENCAAVVITRPMVNIDEPIEIEMAEWLLNRNEKLGDR